MGSGLVTTFSVIFLRKILHCKIFSCTLFRRLLVLLRNSSQLPYKPPRTIPALLYKQIILVVLKIKNLLAAKFLGSSLFSCLRCNRLRNNGSRSFFQTLATLRLLPRTLFECLEPRSETTCNNRRFLLSSDDTAALTLLLFLKCANTQRDTECYNNTTADARHRPLNQQGVVRGKRVKDNTQHQRCTLHSKHITRKRAVGERESRSTTHTKCLIHNHIQSA